MHNITYISQHFLEWSLQGYILLIGGGVFWAIIFTIIGAYIYLKMQSLVVWAIAMLILVAAFSNALLGVEAWITMIHIFVALSVTGLFLMFFTKYRR